MNKIIEDLRNLGVNDGDVLLVHSSYKSLGMVEGGPVAVIEALQSAVGLTGTLLFPTLSFATVTPENPYFDSRTTPSCVGAMSNIFLQLPDTIRSLSPTHSVTARGRLAKELTEGQEADDTPVGVNSPFRRLRDYNGKILMLGCGLAVNTSMHGVEELCEPPYLFQPNMYTYHCVDQIGIEHTIKSKRHGFHGPNALGKKYRQRYDRVIDILNMREDYSNGNVLAADCTLYHAKPMWEKAVARIRQDAFFFVDEIKED